MKDFLDDRTRRVLAWPMDENPPHCTKHNQHVRPDVATDTRPESHIPIIPSTHTTATDGGASTSRHAVFWARYGSGWHQLVDCCSD